MRVFSQINNCQRNKQKTKTNKQSKKGAPPLGLAKSIYYTIELVIWFIGFLIQKAFSDFVVEIASANLQGLFQTLNFPYAEPNANERSFVCVCVCVCVCKSTLHVCSAYEKIQSL